MQTNLLELLKKRKRFSRERRWFETRLLTNYCWYIPMIKQMSIITWNNNEVLSTYKTKTKKTNME